VITVFRSVKAGGPSFVLVRPRMWLDIFLAFTARSKTWRLKVSFLSNQTPSQRGAGYSPSFTKDPVKSMETIGPPYKYGRCRA
jgi:hypothetical protein